MKQAPSSSWSIRDVPLETREQATAAASREGLSVGDWLARNIIADTGFSVADGRLEESPVRRNGNETAASNQNRQRIDEALLSLARLLESHERAQEHASSAMQGVASEIEGAVRSQAGILQRLHQRVETVEGQSGGIAERGRQTAARLSALAHDLEALGNKIVSASEASDRRGLFVQEQLSAIAERMRAGEARVSNYPQVEQAVTKLSDSYVGAAARLQDLGAKFEKLTADLHAARDLSNRTMNSLQERLAGIDSRVRGTEARVASYAEIESAVGKLNEGSAYAAEQVGALFSSVDKLGGDVASARQESAKLGTVISEQLAVIAARLRTAEEQIAGHSGLDKTIEALNAQDNAIAGKVSALYTSFARLQDEMQSVREESANASEVLQERFAKANAETVGQIGTLSGNVSRLHQEMQSVRESADRLGTATEGAAAQLRDRMNALEDHAKTAAASIRQNEEAIRILIEHDKQHAGELGTVRDTLARFEHLLVSVQEENRDALNRVDANLGEISAKLAKSETVAEAPASGAKSRSAPDERVSGTMAPAEAGEAAILHEPTHGTHSEAVMAETMQHEEIAEPVDMTATASEGEGAEAVHHDLRTWLTPAAIQSPAGDEFALPHQPEFSTEGEFALPPHQHEPSMDSVLDLEHEVPNAPASDDIASSTSEPDYLSEARRLAREAHEQVTREHGLHANFEKMKEQARSRILRPALLGAIVLLLLSWLAFRFAHNTQTAAPVAPHITKSKIIPVMHARAPSRPKSTHAQATPAKPQAPAAANAASAAPAETASVMFGHVRTWAENGDRNAMLALGIAYDKGVGVAADEKRATAWLQKSAEAENAVAQFRLGVRLEKGVGAPKDPTEAVHWYKQAAAHGNRSAMYNLGVAIANGTGTAKDMGEAARWFRSAATLGLTDAQFNLAVLYEHGWGVKQSLADAYQWYCIAAANGDSQSSEHSEALATQIPVSQKAATDRAIAAFRAESMKVDANELPEMARPFAP